MNQSERNIALTLAGVFAMRMFGLFLVLPVLAVLADSYPDATPTLVGLALGAYGLTQALLQIPMGRWSDKIGRKPVIYLGLLLFFSGSVIAGLADSFSTIVIGRALQGAGAIGAVVMAFAADNIREQHRSKGMAIIGMSIGLSFVAAIVAGPVISASYGLPGLFFTTAFLSLVALFLIRTVPEHKSQQQSDSPWRTVLTNNQLMRLNLSIFSLHFVLSAFFLFVPLTIKSLGFDLQSQTFIYLPVLFVSVLLMVPAMIITEKKQSHKLSLMLAVCTLIAVIAANLFSLEASWLFVLMTLFFAAFNLLESLLPALISRVAPAINRGTAMGVYSTSQFLGVFAGGSLAGLAMQYIGTKGALYACIGMLIIWLIGLLGFKDLSRNQQLQVDFINQEQLDWYSQQRQVVEVQRHGDTLVVTYAGEKPDEFAGYTEESDKDL